MCSFWIQTCLCNFLQYLCSFRILVECNPKKTWSRNGVGSHKSTSFTSTFHIGSMFCFFPASFLSSTNTEKNCLCLGLQINFPNLELFPNRSLIELSSPLTFSRAVLPEDDRTDFAQEERLGLPCWTMILAICVLVDASKCLEFSITMVHLPFRPGCTLILHLLLALVLQLDRAVARQGLECVTTPGTDGLVQGELPPISPEY